MTRRIDLAIALMAAPLLALAATPAPALDNIEIMAPAAPGGGYDRTARALQATIEKEGLGKGITVINVGGAGGAIGLAQFIRNKAGRSDGMIVGGFGMVASFTTNRSKVTLADVTPLARLTGEYNIVVVPTKSPIKSLKDLVALVKKDVGKVSWAGGSAGGNDHMLAASIVQAAGLDPRKTNYVAFSGGGDSLASILGGQVTVGVGGYSELIEQVKAKNLRALGISATDRVPGIDMPTLREQGVDVTFSNWRGVAAPPKLSAEQRQAYLGLIDKAVKTKTWKGELAKNSWVDSYLAGDAFAKYITEETKRVTALLTTLGLIKGAK
jgi:putative tricarboxylic transport membrane protein